MEYSIPHYRLVTEKDKKDVMLAYSAGMMPCGDDVYNYPLASWNEHDSLKMIRQAHDMMGWNLHFMNDKFYHIAWILPKKKKEK